MSLQSSKSDCQMDVQNESTTTNGYNKDERDELLKLSVSRIYGSKEEYDHYMKLKTLKEKLPDSIIKELSSKETREHAIRKLEVITLLSDDVINSMKKLYQKDKNNFNSNINKVLEEIKQLEEYTPEQFMDEAKMYLSKNNLIDCAEKIYYAFSTAVKRYYADLKIYISDHEATTILCKIAITCCDATDAVFFYEKILSANECHRSSYNGSNKIFLENKMSDIANFMEEFTLIEKEKVKKKLDPNGSGNYSVNKKFGEIVIYKEEEEFVEKICGQEYNFKYIASTSKDDLKRYQTSL